MTIHIVNFKLHIYFPGGANYPPATYTPYMAGCKLNLYFPGSLVTTILMGSDSFETNQFNPIPYGVFLHWKYDILLFDFSHNRVA